MEWSRAGGEKLNQEDRAFEKHQDIERQKRKQLAEHYQKNKLELDPNIEYSTAGQKEPTSFLDLLTEVIIDLLG